MQKKIFILLIIIALFFSIVSLARRYGVEKNSRNVMMTMNSRDIYQLADSDEQREKLLMDLKDRGLSGVAVHKVSLEELVDRGEILFISGTELKKMDLLYEDEKNIFMNFPYDQKSGFIYGPDKYKSFVSNHLPFREEDGSQIVLEELETGFIVFFENWQDKYREISGFDREEIAFYRKLDFETIPVFTDIIKDYEFFEDVVSFSSASSVMFSGERMSAVVNEEKELITEIVQFMKEQDVSPGVIEPFLAPQQLPLRIARNLNYQMLRTHIVLAEEMERYTPQHLTARYLRAVRERNVRLLYLRPFLEVEGETVETVREINLSFIEMLNSELEAAGYDVAPVEPLPFFASGTLVLLFVLLGIAAALCLVLEAIKPGLIRSLWGGIPVAFILLSILVLISGREILLRQLLALTAAISFPVLAVSYGLYARKRLAVVWMMIISLTGGLLIAASLNHVSFSLQVYSFRGVKLALLIPLVVIVLYLLKIHFDDFGTGITKIVNMQVTIGHFMLALFFLFVVVYYIIRSGNFPFISAAAVEIRFREFLEEALVVRPRFKEFLIGYPAAVIFTGLPEKADRTFWYYLLIVVAAAAPISVVNTFSHIHTPLTVSVLRTVIGLFTGLLLGLVLLGILKLLDHWLGIFEFLGGLKHE